MKRGQIRKGRSVVEIISLTLERKNDKDGIMKVALTEDQLVCNVFMNAMYYYIEYGHLLARRHKHRKIL